MRTHERRPIGRNCSPLPQISGNRESALLLVILMVARAAIIEAEKSYGITRYRYNRINAPTVLVPPRRARREGHALPFPVLEVTRGGGPGRGFAFAGVENVERGM